MPLCLFDTAKVPFDASSVTLSAFRLQYQASTIRISYEESNARDGPRLKASDN